MVLCNMDDLTNKEMGLYSWKQLPPFYAADPRFWFRQVEAYFYVARIESDRDRFEMVIAETDPEVLYCAKDLIFDPPEDDKYEALKKHVIESRGSTDGRMHRQFGDNKKPSALLHSLRELVDGELNDAVLRRLWLRQLPTNIQQVLEQVEGELDTLGVLADSLAGNTNWVEGISCAKKESTILHEAKKKTENNEENVTIETNNEEHTQSIDSTNRANRNAAEKNSPNYETIKNNSQQSLLSNAKSISSENNTAQNFEAICKCNDLKKYIDQTLHKLKEVPQQKKYELSDNFEQLWTTYTKFNKDYTDEDLIAIKKFCKPN